MQLAHCQVRSARRRAVYWQARRAQPADALYLRLDESKIVESEEVSPGVVSPLILRPVLSRVEGLSKDGDNQVVGVEILHLSLRAPRLEPGNLAFETTPAAANG